MTACQHCGRPTMPRTRWKALSAAERKALMGPGPRWGGAPGLGMRSMEGRGLCSTCYPKFKDDYDRSNRRLEEVLEDWEHLAEPMVPVRQEVRRLAPRLGMKPKTLEKIITMHVGSRFQGGAGEKLKEAS